MSEGQKLTTVFQISDDTLIIIAKSLVLLTALTLYNFVIKTNSSVEKRTLTFPRNRIGRRLKKIMSRQQFDSLQVFKAAPWTRNLEKANTEFRATEASLHNDTVKWGIRDVNDESVMALVIRGFHHSSHKYIHWILHVAFSFHGQKWQLLGDFHKIRTWCLDTISQGLF